MRITRRCTLISLSAIVSQKSAKSLNAKGGKSTGQCGELPAYDSGNMFPLAFVAGSLEGH